MITYEPGPAQARSGEEIVAGRRIAGRLLPYGAGPFRETRFDPASRRLVVGRADATIACGPAMREPRGDVRRSPQEWLDALARIPAGPVLVGPGTEAEPLRGSLAAALAAARDAGRAVYLLDPHPAAAAGVAAGGVALCAWRPGPGRGDFPGLPETARAGLPATAVFPLIPGWTAEPDVLASLADEAREAGAAAFVGVVPDLSGEGRRAIVEARTDVEPSAEDRFFETIHHGDWTARLSQALAESRRQAEARGMESMPPRPAGREPRANSAAAARLEETAELASSGEHRDSLLLAAVRWIDESGRDLGAIAREGNFRRIFPWGGAVADASEAALLQDSRP